MLIKCIAYLYECIQFYLEIDLRKFYTRKLILHLTKQMRRSGEKKKKPFQHTNALLKRKSKVETITYGFTKSKCHQQIEMQFINYTTIPYDQVDLTRRFDAFVFLLIHIVVLPYDSISIENPSKK